MREQSRRAALRFALYYAAFGIIWVLGTDLLATRIAPGISELQWLSTLKGWFFVLLSTGLVYLLAFANARSHERSIQVARDNEHRFRGLMEQAPDMVFWLTSPDYSRVHYVSATLERLWGFPPERLYEDPAVLLEFVHPDDREQFRAARDAARDGGSSEREFRIVRPDGEVRWMRSQAYPIEVAASGFDGVAGVTQDITQRSHLQAEVEASRDLLRRYLANKIADSERQRIVLAREIHDHIGQLLTVVKLQLGRESRHAAGERYERLVETMAVVDSAIKEMRNISARLRPLALDQLGLVEALEDYVAEFSEDSGLPASFSSDVGQVRFDGEVSGHLFRIVQEALTNVVRHARAEEARVELRSEAGAIVLRILDDGVGLSKQSPAQADGLGIVGMQERAVLVGGSLELMERDPNGLEVCVRVPYDEVVDASGRQG